MGVSLKAGYSYLGVIPRFHRGFLNSWFQFRQSQEIHIRELLLIRPLLDDEAWVRDMVCLDTLERGVYSFRTVHRGGSAPVQIQVRRGNCTRGHASSCRWHSPTQMKTPLLNGPGEVVGEVWGSRVDRGVNGLTRRCF